MKWSKLKQQIEAQFADSVRIHAAIHITRYGPGVSSTMTRGWLTWDGAEVFSFSTIAWLQAEHTEAANPLASDKPISIPDQLNQRGVFSRFDLTDALATYLNLSIDSALSSPDPIISAMAMFDRRVGKRRLQQFVIDEMTHPFVKQLYDLRCQAEQLSITETNDNDRA
jgi:hypothetical protein